jgi:hypothetical protein
VSVGDLQKKAKQRHGYLPEEEIEELELATGETSDPDRPLTLLEKEREAFRQRQRRAPLG